VDLLQPSETRSTKKELRGEETRCLSKFYFEFREALRRIDLEGRGGRGSREGTSLSRGLLSMLDDDWFTKGG